jgi:hypothetical protein
MTHRFRVALAFVLILALAASAATVEVRSHGAQFGSAMKSRVQAGPVRASFVRDTSRRSVSGGGRLPVARSWLHDLPRQHHSSLLAGTGRAPRLASTFPPHWSSLHLNI